jgi:hypothetical protein
MRKLIYSFFIFISISSGLRSQVNPFDSIELIRLRQAFGGFNGGVVSGWNALLAPTAQWDPNNPVTSWYGVTLIQDPQGIYRVSKINLNSLSLDNFLGTLVAQPINSLDSLSEIHLKNCNLSGHIENFLGPLQNLKLIDLDSNSMVYDAASYSNLLNGQPAMKVLRTRATFNTFFGITSLNLPTFMPALEIFDAGENGFEGAIPDFNTFFPNLIQGYFDNNRFTAMSQTIGTRLSKLVISNNIIRNVGDITNVLDAGQSLEVFIANAAMDTAAVNGYPFIPLASSPISVLPKLVELRANKLIGLIDLNYFGNASKTYSLDLSFNLIDSLIPFNSQEIRNLNLSNNRISMQLSAQILDAFPNIERLYLNNNSLRGFLPQPITAGFYNWPLLQELDLSKNPNIGGLLIMDWLFGAQSQVSPARVFRISENRFDRIQPLTNNNLSFQNLKELKVDRNSFQFDDLYNITQQFQLRQVPLANNPSGNIIQHYIPAAITANSDTLSSFIYFPQDSAGIGGVRRRPEGDSMVFLTTVGYPPNIVHNVLWIRDSIGVTQQMGQLNATNNIGNFQSSIGQVIGVSMAVGSNPAAIKISNLDSTYHSGWFVRAETRHDSFPLLMIPVRPKKVKVGDCVDFNGGKTLCQQIVIQFKDTVSFAGKERVRNEFGIELLDSCVCGSIELWGFPDTLNQVDLENLGTGTRTTSGQANNKAELLSADPNYNLLGQGIGTLPRLPNFTNGSPVQNPTLVAIIDSGVDYEKPEIKNRFWIKQTETNSNGIDDDNDCEIDNAWGWNYLDRNNITYDDHGHGTSVAGVLGGYNPGNLAANNSSQDRLAFIPYKYTNAEGKGTVFNAACALRHAADYRDTSQSGSVNRVKVINASWGYYGEPCIVLENTIVYSGRNCDLLLVTSAGNDGVNTQANSFKHWPSNSPFVADSTISYNDNVIAVGALDSADVNSLAYYSNYSPRHIDLAAPGTVQIFNANDNTNTFYQKNGTSFAAPQVARIAALLFDEFPDASASAVKFAILRGVDTLLSSDSNLLKSGGRLNYQRSRLILQGMNDRYLCRDSFNFVLSVNQEILNNDFASVNPNPFSDEISIRLINRSEIENLNVKIIDLSGRMLLEKNFDNGDNFILNTEELPNGFYIVQLNQGISSQITKLLKFK